MTTGNIAMSTMNTFVASALMVQDR